MQKIAKDNGQGTRDFDVSPAGRALEALNRQTETTPREKLADASYYRALARPRSEKYLRLISRQIQIAERLNELYDLQQGVGVTKSSGDMDGGNKIPESGAVTDAAQQESASDSVKQNAMLDSTKMETEGNETPEQESQERTRDAIAEEIARLKEELAWVQKEAEIEMPIGHGRLGFLYRSDKENRLLNMGVISSQGTAYANQDELLERLPIQSEQEKKGWISGDLILKKNWSQCLVVEVYPTVICVVYEDGSVKNYRLDE